MFKVTAYAALIRQLSKEEARAYTAHCDQTTWLHECKFKKCMALLQYDIAACKVTTIGAIPGGGTGGMVPSKLRRVGYSGLYPPKIVGTSPECRPPPPIINAELRHWSLHEWHRVIIADQYVKIITSDYNVD